MLVACSNFLLATKKFKIIFIFFTCTRTLNSNSLKILCLNKSLIQSVIKSTFGIVKRWNL